MWQTSAVSIVVPVEFVIGFVMLPHVFLDTLLTLAEVSILHSLVRVELVD